MSGYRIIYMVAREIPRALEDFEFVTCPFSTVTEVGWTRLGRILPVRFRTTMKVVVYMTRMANSVMKSQI